MKEKIDALIVVEGKTDINFLDSFIDAQFYKVDGLAITKNDIDFINLISKKKEVIILLDPDNPGKKIREKINFYCNNVTNLVLNKSVCISKNKVGVAESSKDAILKALNNRVKKINYINKVNDNLLSINELYNIGLYGKDNSKKLREKILNHFQLDYLSNKMFLYLINVYNLSKEDIMEIIKDGKE